MVEGSLDCRESELVAQLEALGPGLRAPPGTLSNDEKRAGPPGCPKPFRPMPFLARGVELEAVLAIQSQAGDTLAAWPGFALAR
jgi:hypothetical protein